MKPETNYKLTKLWLSIKTAIAWMAITLCMVFFYCYFFIDKTQVPLLPITQIENEDSSVEQFKRKPLKLKVPFEQLKIYPMEAGSDYLYFDGRHSLYIWDIKDYVPNVYVEGSPYCIIFSVGTFYKERAVCFNEDERLRDEQIRYLDDLRERIRGKNYN